MILNNLGDVAIGITYEHARIHKGELFYFADRQTTASVLEYLVRVGPIPVHIRLSIAVGAGVSIDVLEGVAITGLTTKGTIFNFNRNSTNQMASTLYTAFTYTGGTIIKPNYAGSGTTPGQASNGGESQDLEYILRINTDYVFKHTPSVSNIMVFNAVMYEEDVINGRR